MKRIQVSIVVAALLLTGARPAEAGKLSQFFASFFTKNKMTYKVEQPKFSEGLSYNKAKVNVDGSSKIVYFHASPSALSSITKLFGYSLGFTAVCMVINRGLLDRTETFKFKGGGYEAEVLFDKNDNEPKVEQSDTCKK